MVFSTKLKPLSSQEEGAILAEGAVAEHERNILFVLRERQSVLHVVMDDVEAGQTPPDLRTGEVHAVVVVPEGRGPLLHRVDIVLTPSVKRPSRMGRVLMVGVGGATPREN